MSADGNPKPFLIRVGIVVLVAAALLGWMLHSGTQRVRDHAGVTARTVPQDMVGVWTSTRDGVVRCIEMAADGTIAGTFSSDDLPDQFLGQKRRCTGLCADEARNRGRTQLDVRDGVLPKDTDGQRGGKGVARADGIKDRN